MKTIFRILVILAAATLIGGLMYVGVNAGGNMTQTRTRGEFDGEGFAPLDGQFHPARDGEFRPDRDGGREDFEGGMFLPFGIVKNLVVVAIIAAIYFSLNKYFVKRKRRAVTQTT